MSLTAKEVKKAKKLLDSLIKSIKRSEAEKTDTFQLKKGWEAREIQAYSKALQGNKLDSYIAINCIRARIEIQKEIPHIGFKYLLKFIGSKAPDIENLTTGKTDIYGDSANLNQKKRDSVYCYKRAMKSYGLEPNTKDKISSDDRGEILDIAFKIMKEEFGYAFSANTLYDYYRKNKHKDSY